MPESNAPYSEPKGCLAEPSFVKANPLNNDYYVSRFEGDPWYQIIRATHDSLNQIVPGYNISQIKEKFGGLRYYIGLPERITVPPADMPWLDTEEKVRAEVDRVIRYAEAWVDGFEYARKNQEVAS